MVHTINILQLKESFKSMTVVQLT